MSLRKIIIEAFETIDWCDECRWENKTSEDYPCNECAVLKVMRYEEGTEQ